MGMTVITPLINGTTGLDTSMTMSVSFPTRTSAT
jgi:hypothetical protein